MLKGHTASVQGVAFSPDGQRLASASVDQTVKVWDVATGQQSLTLNGHTKEVWSVAFSPDGQQLASASYDQTIKVWDAVTGQEALTLHGHTNEVNSVAYSPNGQRLASASWDHTVKVWHVGTGHELLTLKGHTWSVVSVAFSPDSQRLASASHDGTVKLWDARPAESNALERMEREAQTALVRHRKTMATYEELQTALRDDQTISTAVRNKALELATQLVSLGSQTSALQSEVAANLSALRQLRPHELLYVRSNRTIAAHRFDDAKVSMFSTTWLDVPLLIAKPKTRSVFVLCKNRLFELVPNTADRPREQRRFPQSVHDLAFHPTEDQIAWCRRDKPNTAPELIVSRFEGTDETNLGFGYDPAWTADGQKLIYTGATSEDGWFIAIREGTQTRRIKVPVHPSIHIYPCPAPDGKQIAFSMKGEDGTMQIGLTSMDGTDIRQLTRAGDFNTKPAFSPDGHFLAFVRGNDRSNARLVIVNMQTGEETILANDVQLIRPVWRTTAAP